MLTLENSIQNVVYNKGLFSIDLSAFSFNWDILNRIFVSTFHKYEKFCPLVKTIQTVGGNPVQMPVDCIYPKAIGFGNSSMITPQAVAVDRQSWTYDRSTRLLSVFTNSGSTASFKIQYLARHTQVIPESSIEPFKVFEGENIVDIQLDLVPDPSTLVIKKTVNNIDLTLNLTSRDRDSNTWLFEGTLGTAELNLTSLVLTITQEDTTAGTINVTHKGKYPAYDIMLDDTDFFETWLASVLLTSLGNIKSVVRMDKLPNDINADDLRSQGLDLWKTVLEFQQQKSHWWSGLPSSRI